MRPVFHGRLGLILAVVSVAGIGAAPAIDGLSSAAMAQGTYSSRYQPPPPPQSDPGQGQYHCPRGSSIANTLTSCQGMHEKKNNDLWKIALAVAITILLALIIKRTAFSHGADGATEQTLLEEGPQLPVSYPEGSLSVQAFARDGWPIVIDFAPQPDTVTQLEVKIGKGRHPRTETFVLDPDGSGGRQLVKIDMPDTGRAATPTPATYVVTSVPIASADTDNPSMSVLAPLTIYGIGGGPRAVGSVAIEHLSFDRTTPGARFGYSAKSEFERARAQVQQLRQDGGTVRIQPVFDDFESNLSVGRQNGSWDGRAGNAPSQGVHRLQVTGWFTTDDRSWVAALAPNLVVQ